MTRLFGGFDSLRHDSGGIARVGRLLFWSLSDDLAGAASLIDHEVPDLKPLGIPIGCCGNSQAKFAIRTATAHWSHSHFLYSFLGLARAHGKLSFWKKPYIAFVHGIEVWPGPWRRPDRIEVARGATMLLCNSELTKRRAMESDPTFERMTVTWLATEEEDCPPSRPVEPPPRVLIVARIDEGYKGHRELIECWPTIVDVIPDAMLTIAGRGPRLEEYKALANQSSVAKNIEFLGFVPEAEMPALWQKTAVFAMPSRGEGFGLVYIEAMRYAVPVVASIHDAGGEVNVDGETGFNVNMDKPDELPERLIALLTDRDRANMMGQAGQQRWAKHFRLSVFRNRVRPMIEEFLKT